ncbi:D-alanyl-D-alanine carboxypeptidase [Microbacterium sp. Au-Mic1]|uniref:D-alanyl-D-alanine carboxypeptidase family protein n=1 Tax=Microbacterium sp. Au-Mic1 TaxID=2906457 RepID=UPI001E5CD4D5|nr:D-alanyl-D-alanine carboxypeptidase [Microbacterium sp. Au-Mic1]MCE4027709.1 D-alanyl-D-alanine carboxypeptidase [Microbacterium sp. Au-Mic1]
MNNDDGPGAAQVDPEIVDAEAPDAERPGSETDESAVEPAGLFSTSPDGRGSAALFPTQDSPAARPLFPAPGSPASPPLFEETGTAVDAASAAAEKDPAAEAARPNLSKDPIAEPIPVATDGDPAPVVPAATPATEPTASTASPSDSVATRATRTAAASSARTAEPIPGTAADATPAAARPLPSASLVRGPDRTPTAALAWVDVARVGTGAAAAAAATPSRALLDDAPHRSLARPGVLVPLAGVLAVIVAYGATTALWPLNAVKPVASPVQFQPAAAPVAAAAWPGSGSAAVGVEGIGTIASAEQPVPMASITKLVTVLASLDKLPLKAGEQGPSFAFTQADSDEYWSYLRQDQSALDVPVGGSLTQYQLYEGILLGSANNYADRLAREVWGSDENYAAAANQWLSQHDLADITVVTPSGFDFGNVSTPRALIQLGEIAEKNPVIAGIVKQKSVELPGAGVVENTNGLIDDAGIVGIKTGTIGDGDDTRYNLLSAKDVKDSDTVVRIYVAALGQGSDQGRVDASRALYAGIEAALKDQPQTVDKGATLGTVDTAWGETTQVVAAADGRVVLWNGASATATTKFSLGDEWKAGEKAGTLSLKGPLDSASVPLELRTALHGPSLWWRLTHPLELFGLTK